MFFISVTAHQKVYSASLMIQVRQLRRIIKKIKYRILSSPRWLTITFSELQRATAFMKGRAINMVNSSTTPQMERDGVSVPPAMSMGQ